MNCRVLKRKKCIITQNYSNNHQAVDIVGENRTLDSVIAHSEGIVTEIVDGRSNIKGSIGEQSYGNYIKIDHQNGYQTLYAHLQNGLNIKKNQKIKRGQVIGEMGESGNAYGKHLHFELLKDNKNINPVEYLNKNLPNNNLPLKEDSKLKYKIGDVVEINGVYISSTSKEKLRPLVTRGKITKILENTSNPYLLEEGRIGWVNENTIISKTNNQYLSNKKYKGTSIVDALKEINIDSSYQHRSELANANNIYNYKGTISQNTQLLNLLKKGLLKY